MTKSITLNTKNLSDFKRTVKLIAAACSTQVRIIFLSGALGAGKTEFARSWLRQRGIQGQIKSPSFSMVESYHDHRGQAIHHMDLYRVNTVSEIRCLGLEDYIDDQLLIEWADRGIAELMPCDLSVTITHTERDGRQLHIESKDKVLIEAISTSLQQRSGGVR